MNKNNLNEDKKPIFNILLNNRLFKKLYIFVKRDSTEIELLKKFLKNKLKASELTTVKQLFKDNYDYWYSELDKIPIEIIEDTINLDDTINSIKRKIFYYLSTKKYLLIDSNQELWIEDNNKNYIPLGYYYENYNYKPSILHKIDIDYKDFVNNIGISRNKYRINNNNNFILYDIINYTNIKDYVINVNNIEFEREYISKEHIVKNDLLTYGYIYKFFPKCKFSYDIQMYKDKMLEAEKVILYEKYVNTLLDKNISILNHNNIVTIKLHSISTMKDDIDLVKIFYFLDVSKDVPFIKFKKTLEWVSPMIKINKESIQDIDKSLLLKWIVSNPRGLLIKKYLYTHNGERKHISINIFSNGKVEINMAFNEDYSVNFYIINDYLKEIEKFIEDINNYLLVSKKTKLIAPKVKFIDNNLFTEKDTKIVYINFVIPLTIKNIDVSKLNIISHNFTNYLIQTNIKETNKFSFKYKKRTNFKNIHEIFFEISYKKNDGLDDDEIKTYLFEKYKKDKNEINELMRVWNKLMIDDKSIKQPGIEIQIPDNKKKIKVLGCVNSLEYYNIIKLFNLIVDIYLNKRTYEKEKDFKKYFKKTYINNINSLIQNNSNENDIDLNNLNVNINTTNFNNSDFKNYINDMTNSEISLDTIHESEFSSENLSNDKDISAEIRLSTVCKDSGSDVKGDTCQDLCEDFYYKNRRLQRHDIRLFKFTSDKLSYSKQCQRNTQPQVLNYNPELNPKIKRNSYTYAIKYGSNPDKQNYFMCPKVWCPKCNIPINYDDIKDTIKKVTRKQAVCEMGKCPYGDHNVFIETSDKHSKTSNGLYPGFIKNKHPEGYCLPCCKTNDMRNPKYSGHKLLKECLNKNNNSNNNDNVEQKYILDANKIPLNKNRFGAISVYLQRLFKNKYKHGNLEIGNKYFVRVGCTNNINQSFFEAISKIISDLTKNEFTITDLKRNIVSKINNNTISKKLFKSLNNGNLELTFKKGVTDNPIENFKKYFKSDDIFIDEHFFIDLFSRPGILFPNGINIFILSSNTIKCYSGCNLEDIYDLNRDSIYIYNHNKYYEPIYLLKYFKRNVIEKVITFNPVYSEPSIIYNLINKYCKSYHDIDWKRLLKDRGKLLNIKYTIFNTKETVKTDFVRECEKLPKKYNIKCQVVDNYNKVIGFVLKNNLFYPIEPTNIDLNYDVCDINYNLLDYKTTIKEYNYLKKNTKLPYKIIGKIIDLSKNLINVLVLESGRYINIKDTKIVKDDIPILDINYFSNADDFISNELETFDKSTIDVKKFNYDEESYNMFELELSKYVTNDKTLKDELKSLVLNNDFKKVQSFIVKLVKELITTKRIIKIDIENYISPNIRRPCYLYNKKYAKTDIKEFCLRNQHCSYINNKCKMYLPEKSLYTNKKNLEYFIKKLSNILLKNKIKYNIFIKNNIKEIVNEIKYYPKETEYYLFGINYLDDFEKIYLENKEIYLENTINNVDNSNKIEYSLTKPIDSEKIFLEDLQPFWYKQLGSRFKIFKVFNDELSLFNSIVKAYNKYLEEKQLDEHISVVTLKNYILDFLSDVNLSTIKKYYLTYLKDYKYDKIEYDIKSKNVKEFILNFYKNFSDDFYKELIDYKSLIKLIDNQSYSGSIVDIYFLSNILNLSIIILHNRFTESNPDKYTLIKSKTSSVYILLHTETVKDKKIFNIIQKEGQYIFKKEDFPKTFSIKF